MKQTLIIPKEEFAFLDKVDQDYIAEFKKHVAATKKTLPHYLAFHGYKMLEDGKFFNGRLIAGGIKPRFVTPRIERHVRERTETFFDVLPTLQKVLSSSKAVQTYFHLTTTEVQLLRAPTPFPHPVIFARFDSVITPEHGLRVYELNTNCAATPGWVEDLTDVLERFPFWASFQKKYHIRYYSTWAKKMYRALLDSYKQWGGTASHPNILILRWSGQYNQDSDFLCQEFQKFGSHAFVGDVQQVHYRDKKVWYHGTAYDLVLRWFDLSHLLEDTTPLYQDILRAFYDGAVCIVNPLSSSVFAHKALFAFFTDERFSSYLTEKQKQILGNMCPWTRIIEKRKTTNVMGDTVELVDYLIKEQKHLLIKPSIGTYGANICIGKKMTKPQWKKVIARGVKDGGWIVQEYITIPQHAEPFVEDNKVSLKYINHDFGPYMIQGRYVGAMAR